MLNSQHEVLITALANSGDGVGRIQDRVVFVPYSCPGDKLQVKITKVQKKFLKARIEKILEASPERETPLCKYHGSCGGCDWQHIQYESQAQWKIKNLTDVLRKIAKIDDAPIQPIKKSSKAFNYRNRLQLEYDQKSFYLHRKGSNELVAIDQCPLAEVEINKAMSEIHSRALKQKKKGRIEIASFPDKVDFFVADKMSRSDLGFRQVHSEQNQYLKKRIHEIVREKAIQHVVDLYCGQGNWALSLAEEFPSIDILGIEYNSTNLKKATEAGALLENPPSFLQGKAEALYDSQIGDNSLIVIDPPRAGCGSELINKLNGKPSPWVVYISCHPATMARDLFALKSKYEVVEVQPVDMFPQTAHLECLTLLRSASQVNTDH